MERLDQEVVGVKALLLDVTLFVAAVIMLGYLLGVIVGIADTETSFSAASVEATDPHNVGEEAP